MLSVDLDINRQSLNFINVTGSKALEKDINYLLSSSHIMHSYATLSNTLSNKVIS